MPRGRGRGRGKGSPTKIISGTGTEEANTQDDTALVPIARIAGSDAIDSSSRSSVNGFEEVDVRDTSDPGKSLEENSTFNDDEKSKDPTVDNGFKKTTDFPRDVINVDAVLTINVSDGSLEPSCNDVEPEQTSEVITLDSDDEDDAVPVKTELQFTSEVDDAQLMTAIGFEFKADEVVTCDAKDVIDLDDENSIADDDHIVTDGSDLDDANVTGNRDGSDLLDNVSDDVLLLMNDGDGEMGGGEMGGGEMGDGEMAEGEMGEDEMGDGEMVEGEMGDGEMGDGEMGDGEMGDGEMAEGEMGEDEMGDGEMCVGEMVDGEIGDGGEDFSEMQKSWVVLDNLDDAENSGDSKIVNDDGSEENGNERRFDEDGIEIAVANEGDITEVFDNDGGEDYNHNNEIEGFSQGPEDADDEKNNDYENKMELSDKTDESDERQTTLIEKCLDVKVSADFDTIKNEDNREMSSEINIDSNEDKMEITVERDNEIQQVAQKISGSNNEPDVDENEQSTAIETENDEEETGDPFYCAKCDVRCGDNAAYHMHTRGMMHTLNSGSATSQDKPKPVPMKFQVPKPPSKRANKTKELGDGTEDDAILIKDDVEEEDEEEEEEDDSQKHNWIEDVQTDSCYCEVCDCMMTGQQSWESHLDGARHKKNLKNRAAGAPIKKPRGKVAVCSQQAKIVDQKPAVQDMLDNCKEPLLGLNFITEYCNTSPDVEPCYACDLCEVKCDVRILMGHLISLKHRLNYMIKFHMNYAILVQQGGRKSDQTRTSNSLSKEIEALEGRQQIVVKLESGFHGKPASKTPVTDTDGQSKASETPEKRKKTTTAGETPQEKTRRSEKTGSENVSSRSSEKQKNRLSSSEVSERPTRSKKEVAPSRQRKSPSGDKRRTSRDRLSPRRSPRRRSPSRRSPRRPTSRERRARNKSHDRTSRDRHDDRASRTDRDRRAATSDWRERDKRADRERDRKRARSPDRDRIDRDRIDRIDRDRMAQDRVDRDRMDRDRMDRDRIDRDRMDRDRMDRDRMDRDRTSSERRMQNDEYERHASYTQNLPNFPEIPTYLSYPPVPPAPPHNPYLPPHPGQPHSISYPLTKSYPPPLGPPLKHSRFYDDGGSGLLPSPSVVFPPLHPHPAEMAFYGARHPPSVPPLHHFPPAPSPMYRPPMPVPHPLSANQSSSSLFYKRSLHSSAADSHNAANSNSSKSDSIKSQFSSLSSIVANVSSGLSVDDDDAAAMSKVIAEAVIQYKLKKAAQEIDPMMQRKF